MGVACNLERREFAVVRLGADQCQVKEFGLTLEVGKTILRRAQAELTQFQVERLFSLQSKDGGLGVEERLGSRSSCKDALIRRLDSDSRH